MATFGLLLERALLLVEDKHKFSSTQFDVTGDLAKRILAFGQSIPDDELAGDGREEHPHVTVKYGLHTGDADEVAEAAAGVAVFTVTLGKVSAFKANAGDDQRGDAAHDVLKVGVSSSALRNLNRRLSDKLEHTDTHSNYNPHITIAYLKPGMSDKYIGDDRFEGTEIEVKSFVFSDRDGETTVVRLGRHPAGKRELATA